MNPSPIRFLAVGQAGARLLAALRAGPLPDAECVHLDTAPEALHASPLARRLTLGTPVNRGLGAGGDPDLGRLSAEADPAPIRGAVEGARLVFVVAGLGGGTGSGAAPVVSRVARESGALVLALVTLPFAFEKRRAAFAEAALARLKAEADAVLVVSNERVRRMHAEDVPPAAIYRRVDDLVVRTLRGVWRILESPGILPLEFAHLERLLRGRNTGSAFACVEISGPDRGRAAAEALLTDPFLDTGAALALAGKVLVSVGGGDDMVVGDIEQLTEALCAKCPGVEFMVGATLDRALTGRIEVLAITARAALDADAGQEHSEDTVSAPVSDAHRKGTAAPAMLQDEGAPREILPGGDSLADPGHAGFPMPGAEPARPVARPSRGGGRRKTDDQLLMNFEVVSRGRFESTERNRHNGVDLDTPTFQRHGIRIELFS
jgi:cell division protein FtsZ